MKFNPWVFVLIAYAITAIVALGVTFIVKLIALIVRGKENSPGESAGQKGLK